jgi:hypothetical protein
VAWKVFLEIASEMCDHLSKLKHMVYWVDLNGMNVLRPADCLLQLFVNRPETVTIYTRTSVAKAATHLNILTQLVEEVLSWFIL